MLNCSGLKAVALSTQEIDRQTVHAPKRQRLNADDEDERYWEHSLWDLYSRSYPTVQSQSN